VIDLPDNCRKGIQKLFFTNIFFLYKYFSKRKVSYTASNWRVDELPGGLLYRFPKTMEIAKFGCNQNSKSRT